VPIEHARARLLPKPWGVTDVSSWNAVSLNGQRIGEIWYERTSATTVDTSLLLKLLFTDAPLSIQVHPDDGFAHAVGLERGKSEAWYVLSAAPGAKVALGLIQHLTQQQLREAAHDGSIANLVASKAVYPGDAISVPAGTIHAIGAGLVIAEIQQRSDTTFRLFDHGSARELHIESAIAVADHGPAAVQAPQARLCDERIVLVATPHFNLERIELPPDSTWRIDATRETWMLVLSGQARIGTFGLAKGGAVFAEMDLVEIATGPAGFVGLVARAGAGSSPDMVRLVQKPMGRGSREAHEFPAVNPVASVFEKTESELVGRTQ
jgi:mannose-6-phosphate isomerase